MSKRYDSRCRSRFYGFNDTATTEIYTLSLHDALPISLPRPRRRADQARAAGGGVGAPVLLGQGGLGDRGHRGGRADRKSTRLNSSHANISYAVFCLEKKGHSYSRDYPRLLTT